MTLCARLTIRRLMAWVVLAAGLMAVYRAFGALGLLLAVECSGVGFGVWLASRGHRRAAARGLMFSAVTATVLPAPLCAGGINTAVYALLHLAPLAFIPLVLGFGCSWAGEICRDVASSRAAGVRAWLLVFFLAASPLAALMTYWPLHLAFRVSERAMNRLGDRIAAGERLNQPELVGLYRIVAARRDTRTGNVALLIDDDPAGGSGFVRIARNSPDDGVGPMTNLNFNINLGGRWRYQDED